MNLMSALSLPVAPLHQRAEGEIDIVLRPSNGRTRLVRFYQQGCLKARCLQIGAEVEIVSINISGGIAGGDVISTGFQVGSGGRAVFTTQAAERIYRSHGDKARVKTCLKVERGAYLAYLPQETILFDGFALDRALEIDLAEGAICVGVESIVFGRMAMGETLKSGYLHDRISVRREGRLIWRDSAKVEGDFSTQFGWAGIGGQARAVASMFAAGLDIAAIFPRLKDVLAGHAAGLSVQDNMVVLRLLATDMAALRRVVTAVLAILRDGALPRVWQS